MKNAILIIVALALVGGQIYWSQRNKGSRTYTNPELGLTLTYPKTWKKLGAESIDRALSSRDASRLMSKETLQATKELLPTALVFSAAKPRFANRVQQSPNVSVAAIPLPKSEWPQIDAGAFLQEFIEGARESIPSAKPVSKVFPRPDFEPLRYWVMQVSLDRREITQVQYIYWQPPNVVLISIGYSHPDDEAEVLQIAASIKIAKAQNANSSARN